MPNLIGHKVDQFEVLERLGSGGMGEVYLARDIHLDRLTALKFLPEEMAQDEIARTRLKREARSAASLDHPSICKVFAIGEFEDKLYLALEYISGRTLQQVLREGLLPLDRAVAIATDICAALDEAHEKGIVHRDLKPSNLMFTERGQVKVLDFGLAKRHEVGVDTDAPLTETGMAIGTIPYMSPEQLNGGKLDGRSDLFSLGILLYEMLTGVHPYGRKVNMETAMAILTKPTPPMHRVGEDIPQHLVALVERMLCKEVRDRPENAAEVSRALFDGGPESGPLSDIHDAATVVTPRPRVGEAALSELTPLDSQQEPIPTSIAVLPFARLSPDPEDEFFADGLADEITTALAKLRPIRVVARTSAFAFKDRNEDVRSIGKELGADSLLQGSVRRSGARVRIGVQLVSAGDGGHLWSERFDRELDDVFAVQDEIAQSVVATLRLQLGSGSLRAIAVPRAANLEAYELYLQGSHHGRTYTVEGMREALRCFQESLELDPEYVPALIGSAVTRIYQVYFMALAPADGYPKALELTNRALALDPYAANANGVLATVRANWEWDFGGAEELLRAALERSSNDSSAHYTLSVMLSSLGRHDESIAEARAASKLDPLNSTVVAQVGYAQYYAGRLEEALATFEGAAERHPVSAMPALGLAVTLRDLGRYEDAMGALESGPDVLGGVGHVTRATILSHLGRADEARMVLAGLEATAQEEMPFGYLRASIHHSLGEDQRALELLELAADKREAMVLNCRVIPTFRGLHGQERFEALCRRIGVA